MDLKQSVVNICRSMQSGLDYYIKSFYNPSFYRDKIYREEGYGLKKLFLVLLGMMLISYAMIVTKVIYRYETIYKTQVRTLPNLNIEGYKLNNFNQSLVSSHMIDAKHFIWLNDDQMSEFSHFKNEKRMILNALFLWIPYDGSNYFGYGFSNLGNFFPVVAWSGFKDFVNGQILVQHIHWVTIIWMLFLTSIPIYFMNCFLIFVYIRFFAYVAKNMVMLALKEVLEYKLTCRLLSLTAIPTMTYMALIIDLWGIHESTKYIFIVIYMLNYYIGLRLIKAKSYFRWLNA